MDATAKKGVGRIYAQVYSGAISYIFLLVVFHEDKYRNHVNSHNWILTFDLALDIFLMTSDQNTRSTGYTFCKCSTWSNEASKPNQSAKGKLGAQPIGKGEIRSPTNNHHNQEDPWNAHLPVCFWGHYFETNVCTSAGIFCETLAAVNKLILPNVLPHLNLSLSSLWYDGVTRLVPGFASGTFFRGNEHS